MSGQLARDAKDVRYRNTDPDPVVRQRVVEALARFAAPDTAPELLRRLADGIYANKREAQRAWQDAETKARAGHV